METEQHLFSLSTYSSHTVRDQRSSRMSITIKLRLSARCICLHMPNYLSEHYLQMHNWCQYQNYFQRCNCSRLCNFPRELVVFTLPSQCAKRERYVSLKHFTLTFKRCPKYYPPGIKYSDIQPYRSLSLCYELQ